MKLRLQIPSFPVGRIVSGAALGLLASSCFSPDPATGLDTDAATSGTASTSAPETSATTSITATTTPTTGTGPSATLTATTNASLTSTTGADSSSGSDSGGCVDGTEGCPCETEGQTCEGFLVCQADTCIDPFPDCGDGVVQASEECDDSNRDDLDGCAFDCTYETMCVVAHEGGTPASVRSWSVARDGTLQEVSSLTLGGEHTPDRFANLTAGATRCGRRIYGILQDADALFGVEISSAGSFTPIVGLPSLTGPRGVLCAEAFDILLTFAGTTTVSVESHAIEAAGTLTALDDVLIVFPFTPDRTYFVMHPDGQQAYIVGEPSGNEGEIHVARLTVDETGVLSLEQPAVPIGIGFEQFVSGAAIDPAGQRLLQLGFSGTGVAVTELEADGTVPGGDNVETFGLAGSQALTHALGTEGDILYVSRITGGAGVITTAEFVSDGLVQHSEVTAAGSRCQMHPLYDYEVIAAGCTFGEVVAAYTVSEDLLQLTEVDTAGGLPVDSFQALVPIACPDA